MKYGRLAKVYHGATAETYDLQRSGGEKWRREQETLEMILQALPRGASVLDIPVGTGRFIEFYQRFGLRPTGMDISADMLAQSRSKAQKAGLDITLQKSDIRRINQKDNSFDVVVCIRFLNWVDLAGFKKAVAELARVSRGHVIIGVRQAGLSSEPAIEPKRNIWSGMRWLWSEIRKRFRRRGLVWHDRRDIENILRQHRLELRSDYCIERRDSGEDYYIYVTEKKRAQS